MPEPAAANSTSTALSQGALLKRLLYTPVDCASLAAFRIAFGSIMFIETVWHWGIIERFFIEPKFHFTYVLTPFVKPLPSTLTYVHFTLIALSALGIALGLFYRLCAAAFFLLYTYLFLIDQAYYNNHFYLGILIAFWMMLAPAAQVWSIDRKLGRANVSRYIAAWPLVVLRAQWVIVYVFGALAKLNGDWLRGQPMQMFLRPHADAPVIGQLLQTDASVMFFAWGGFFFDLLIGPALLFRQTRPYAIVGMLIFHISNHFLFHIGIFPFFALASILLFLEPSTPRLWVERLRRSKKSEKPVQEPTAIKPSPLLTGFIIAYLVVQVLLPLRVHLYPGHVSWTHEAWYFSWTMKLEHKDCFVGMQVVDPATQQSWEIDQTAPINAFQRHRMWQDPAMIAQFARFIREQAKEGGIAEPMVIVDAVASMNGRPFQYVIDPRVDIAATDPSWPVPAPWIVPLMVDAPIGTYLTTERETIEQVLAVIHAHRSKVQASGE